MRVKKDKKNIIVYETVGIVNISVRDSVRSQHFKTKLRSDERIVITFDTEKVNETKKVDSV